MEIFESTVSEHGEVQIPNAVQQQLALAPGSRIEWLEKNGEIIIRRAKNYSSLDIHNAVFKTKPCSVSIAEMDTGIQRHLSEKHERR